MKAPSNETVQKAPFERVREDRASDCKRSRGSQPVRGTGGPRGGRLPGILHLGIRRKFTSVASCFEHHDWSLI